MRYVLICVAILPIAIAGSLDITTAAADTGGRSPDLSTPVLKVLSSPGSLTLCNTATVKSNENDPDTEDNSSIVCITLDLTQGTLCNTATAASSENDPDPSNNVASVCGSFIPGDGSICNTVVVRGSVTDPDGANNTVTVCSFVTPFNPDVNDDGKVTVADLLIVVAALGSQPPIPSGADVNGDGVVDEKDVVLVALNL